MLSRTYQSCIYIYIYVEQGSTLVEMDTNDSQRITITTIRTVSIKPRGCARWLQIG